MLIICEKRNILFVKKSSNSHTTNKGCDNSLRDCNSPVQNKIVDKLLDNDSYDECNNLDTDLLIRLGESSLFNIKEWEVLSQYKQACHIFVELWLIDSD